MSSSEVASNMKVLLIILMLRSAYGLDPAAYGNPSGQLSTQVKEILNYAIYNLKTKNQLTMN